MLVDGRLTDRVPADDRGLLYGDGHFTTVAFHGGRPLCWELHLARLAEAGARLALPMPDAARLAAEARCVAAGLPRAVVRITLTRGSGARGYAPPQPPAPRRILAAHPWPADLARRRAEGVRVITCRTPLGDSPLLGGLKHLGRLEQVLARAEVDDAGAEEGLMRDPRGQVVEATAANLFLVDGEGVLVTPAIDRCGVAGVLRARVLEHAVAAGIPCRVEPVARGTLDTAQELFLSNSITGLVPLRSLDGRSLTPGPLARRLQGLLAEAGDLVPC